MQCDLHELVDNATLNPDDPAIGERVDLTLRMLARLIQMLPQPAQAYVLAPVLAATQMRPPLELQ